MAQSRIAQLLFKLSADNKALLSTMKSTETRMSKFQKNMGKIGMAIGGAFAVQKVVEFGKRASEMAGKMEGVEVAFNKLNDATLLDNLRKATNNTTNDLELMQQSVKANNFRIPMDVFAKGLEFATKRANETGESIDYMVNSFTTGLGRESIKILDNLGISALELNEEVAKTGDFTLAVGNIMDRELTKMGDHMDTDAQKTQQLSAAMDNLAIVVGDTLNPVIGVLKGFLIDTTIGAAGLLEAVTSISGSEHLSFWQKLTAILGNSNSAFAEALAIASGYIETEDEKMDRLGKEAQLMAKKLTDDERALELSKKAKPIIQELIDKIAGLNAEKMLLTATDKIRFGQINDEIQLLEKEKKSYSKLSAVIRDQNEAKLSKKGFGGFAIAPIDTTALADMSGAIQAKFDAVKNSIGENVLDLSGMVEASIENTITNIADSLGQLAAGGIGLDEFFKNIISGFASFLKQMGGMLIAYGVALAAFEFSGNPWAMIAAGAAMVAIGAAIGVLSARGASGGAMSGGGGSGGSSFQSTGFTSQPIQLQGVIKGEDIHIVTQNYQSRTNRTGG